MASKKASEKKIAIHEAGHAVACERLFPWRLVGNLTIVPDVEGNAAGSHEMLEAIVFDLTTDPEELARQNEVFANQAVYFCAGYAACLAAGHSERTALAGCGNDFERAEAAASWPELTLSAVKQRAIELMRRAQNIAAVERVADELLARRTIGGDEVEWLVGIADGTLSEQDYRQFLASRIGSKE
jgi:hypothetical protein